MKGQKNNTEDVIKSFDNNEHQSNTWGNVQYFHTHHCFPKNLTLFSTKKLVSKGRKDKKKQAASEENRCTFINKPQSDVNDEDIYS